MEKFFLKSKTIIFFSVMAALSAVTFFEGFDVKGFLFQAVCHVSPEAQIVADECTGKVIKVASAITGGMSVVAVWLRTLSSSQIFISLFGPKSKE